MIIPDWAKTTGCFLIIIILWDIIRLFLQSWVNNKFMQKDFNKLNEAIENVIDDNEEN